MTNDQQQAEGWRKQFESLFDDNLLQRGSHGEYLNDHRNSMWHGFCLAKINQSVVELPEGDSDVMVDLGEVHAAITAAGCQYKIKGE